MNVDNGRLKFNNNQSRWRSIEQAVSHMWRNSNTFLLSKIYADDVVQQNSKSFTIQISSSEDDTTLKSSTWTVNLHYLKNEMYNE